MFFSSYNMVTQNEARNLLNLTSYHHDKVYEHENAYVDTHKVIHLN